MSSPRVVQSASWQSASWRIRELSSNHVNCKHLTEPSSACKNSQHERPPGLQISTLKFHKFRKFFMIRFLKSFVERLNFLSQNYETFKVEIYNSNHLFRQMSLGLYYILVCTPTTTTTPALLCENASDRRQGNFPHSAITHRSAVTFRTFHSASGYWTTRRYANSRTGRLTDWSTRGLDNSRTGQLADATGDFECLVFVLLAASAIPRVVQSAS